MIREPEFTNRSHGQEPVRILLVEDDPICAELLRAQLRTMPFVQSRLEVVERLSDALVKLAADTFGLVLADLNLPDSAGLATLQALAAAAEQPIVVITGDRDPDLRARALECGAYDFLSKDQLRAATLERLIRLAGIQANTLRALRDSRARFADLLALSTDWHWEQDEEFRYTRFEGRVDELFGSDSRPLIGKRRWEVPANEPVSGTWDDHRATLEAHLPFRNFETRRLRDDGRVRYVSASGEPVFDAYGNFRGYRGVATDITDRKQAESALRESESRFRSTFELAGSGMAHIGMDRRFLRVNRRLCEILGYPEEELLQLTGRQISHPDDLDVINEERPRLYAGEIDAVRVEKRYVRKDGSVVWVKFTMTVERDAAGKPIYEIGVYDDVTAQRSAETALRASEARFRSLSALSSDWYWEQDADLRLTFMSSIEKTGLDARSYLGLRRWDRPALNLSEDDWARHRAQLERHEPFRDFEVERPAPGGGSVWMTLSGEPVFDERARFVGYRGIGRDITRRKRNEQQVAQLGRMYAALGGANEAILRAKSPQEVFDETCRIAVGAGGFLLGSVFLLDPHTGRLRRAAASGAAAKLAEITSPSIDATLPEGRGLIGHACRAGAPAVSNDYAADGRIESRRGTVRGYEVGSAAVFPLRVDGALVGVLGLQHAERGAFGEELTGLLQRLADNIAFALENFRREERRQAAEREARDAEAALRQSEAWFRQTFELAGSGIAHVDLNGRFLRVNRRLCEILGYAEDELVGRSVKQISHPEDRDVTDAQRARMRAGEIESAQMEKRYLRRDGSTVWVELTVALARDAQGAPLYEISILEDVSERKAGEAALRESEARFRSLTELSADFYWETDAQHRVVTTTHDAKHHPINARGGQIGRTRWEVPSTRPDAAGWAAHRAMLDAHLPFREFELARVDAEGVERHLSISGEPMFDAAGGFIGYRGVGKEITSRKREESLLALEHEVTRRLADAETAAAGVRAVIRAVCETQSWPCGRYFAADDEAYVLRFAEAWGVSEPAVERYLAKSRDVVYARGQGLSGVVWESGEAMWVRDVSKDRRASGSARGALQGGAFVFPVTSGGRTIGVLSFASADVRDPDARLLQAVQVIGSQIGQFLMRKKAEKKQRRREQDLERFRAAMDMSFDAIYLTDRAAMRFVDVNKVGCKWLGYTREELLKMGPQDVLAASREELEREYDAVIAEGSKGTRVETTYAGKDGRTGWTELHRRALRSGERWFIVTISRDITERKLAEERQAAHLRYQERTARFGQSALAKRDPAELIQHSVQELLEALAADAAAYFEAGPDGSELVVRALVGVPGSDAGAASVACGRNDPVLQVLASGSRLLIDGAGLEPAWARGLRSAALIPVRGEGGVRGVLLAGRCEADAFGAEALNFVDAAASVLSTALQRIDSEGRLAYLAQFDPLTGLPNRALLSDRFSQMIAQAKRHDRPLAVLFIDLDEFKLVNDTIGHAGGDALLKEVAVRLQSTVRSGDTVARISGDEFAVVLADLARPEDAALVAQKIIDRLSSAVEVLGTEVFVTASVGIAAFPGDGADAETLIGAADAAMYRAKQSGRNAYQFFTAEINQRSRARAQLGSELRRALEREEFALVYQPKYRLANRRPCGAEALLRWKHPERGTVSPAEFIPVLEETGLIVPVGDWVLRRACEDLKAWRAAGLDFGPVSVNLSARQFRLQDLDTRIKSIVASAGIQPGLIELEITESQLMQDPDHAIRVMRALCDAGMRIAVDDFGTGYSSLSYLTRFPLAALKIDRSFVKDMSSDKGDATIVRAIIEMAHTLGLTVIAEGVETEDQATFLRLLRCEQAQGYLFAKPMPAADFGRLISGEH